MGCAYMFNEKKIDQLRMMYNIFMRVESTLKYNRNYGFLYNARRSKNYKELRNLKRSTSFYPKTSRFKR